MSGTIEQYGLAALQPFVPAKIAVSNVMALLEPMEVRRYATAGEIGEMRQALIDWAENSQGIFCFTRCEAIAVK